MNRRGAARRRGQTGGGRMIDQRERERERERERVRWEVGASLKRQAGGERRKVREREGEGG
jgi:hypothetical protein